MDQLEQNIITLIKEEPEKAFSLMYDHYYDFLARVVFRILQDESITQDIIQSVFIGIWKKRASIQINTSLKQYLRRAAINHSLNHLRSNKNLNNDPIEESGVFNDDDHTLVIEAEEMHKEIGEAMESLPERCRLIFSLSRYEDLSYKEIAENLDISVKTVENQITKALKLMRNKINKKI